MHYTLVARKRGVTPEVVAVTQYSTNAGVKAAVDYCQRIYAEWQGFNSWSAEQCDCQNNEDYCDACLLLRTYTHNPSNAAQLTDIFRNGRLIGRTTLEAALNIHDPFVYTFPVHTRKPLLYSEKHHSTK